MLRITERLEYINISYLFHYLFKCDKEAIG